MLYDMLDKFFMWWLERFGDLVDWVYKKWLR